MRFTLILGVLAVLLAGCLPGMAEQWCNNNVLRKTIDRYEACGLGNYQICYVQQGLKPGTPAFAACQAALAQCYQRIDLENQEIRRGNELYHKCRKTFDKGRSAKNDWKSRINRAQQRNSAMGEQSRINEETYQREVGNRLEESDAVMRQRGKQAEREYNAMLERQRKARANAAQRQRSARSRPQTDHSGGSPTRGTRLTCPGSGDEATPRCWDERCQCPLWDKTRYARKCEFYGSC